MRSLNWNPPAEPFARLSTSRQRRLLAALLVLEGLELGALLALERRMKRTGGPGIIPFELAGSPERAQRILDAWGPEGRSAAKLSLLLDYPYPATYAPVHALACTAAGRSLARRREARALARLAGPMAWAQLAAALFDYIENTALLAILAGRDGKLPALARRAALTKFALLYGGWGYLLAGGAAGARRRLARRRG